MPTTNLGHYHCKNCQSTKKTSPRIMKTIFHSCFSSFVLFIGVKADLFLNCSALHLLEINTILIQYAVLRWALFNWITFNKTEKIHVITESKTTEFITKWNSKVREPPSLQSLHRLSATKRPLQINLFFVSEVAQGLGVAYMRENGVSIYCRGFVL